MAKPHARKGASRKANTNKNFLENFSVAKFLLVASLVVLALVVYGSFSAVQTVLDVPVSQVDVEGEFHYLTEGDVNRVISAYVNNGFVTVDLGRLRDEFMALPWVYQASIRRKLPNGLQVSLVEQKPAAYWNDNGMINEAGETFFPSTLPVIEGLPRLTGKSHSAVLYLFRELEKALPASQQPVRSLTVSDSNVVQAELPTGARLVFKAADLQEKMTMWKTIASSDLGSRLGEVDYVDLRYSNGAAVMWKNQEGVQPDKTAGGDLNGK